MKPNEVSFAETFGLSSASLNAIKKKEQKNVEPSNAPEPTVPLSAGASAFAFRNYGVAELFQGKRVRT